MPAARSMKKILFLIALLACSCADHSADVIKQASFDHDCPEAQIKVMNSVTLGENDRKGYVLDVCGTIRKYTDVGERAYVFVEVKK